MFVLCSVVFFAAIACTVALVFVKRAGPLPGEQLRVRETRMGAVLGLALWVESGSLLYILIQMPERLGTASPVNTWACAIVSLLLGCFMVLYGCVKVVIAGNEGFTSISPLGQRTSIRWDEVAEVHNVRKRLLFLAGDSKATVGGKRQQLEQFTKLAAGKIKPEVGEDILTGFLTQFGNPKSNKIGRKS